MAVNLSPVGGVAAQFFDNSGQVLTGGKLYTYLAGTTTPAITYTTNSGIVANSNPIVLNAAGRVADSGEIWLTDGINYKFVLKDSNDVQIAVWDNIIGINSNFVNYTLQEQTFTATQGQTVFTLTGGLQYTPATNNLSVFVNGSKQVAGTNYLETSTTVFTFVTGLNVGDVVDAITAIPVASNVANSINVSYNPPFTNSVTTNVQTKLSQSVSIKDFGAVGNGTTDDTAAIQAAFNYAIPNSIQIIIPAGTYLINGTITITKTSGLRNPTYITGGGTLYKTNAGTMFTAANAATSDIFFNDIFFLGSLSANVVAFYCGQNLINTYFTNCCFKNLTTCFDSSGYLMQSFYLQHCIFTSIATRVFNVPLGVNNLKIEQCTCEAMSTGSFFYGSANSLVIRDSLFENFTASPVMQFLGGGSYVIDGNYFEANAYGDIVFSGSNQATGIMISNNSSNVVTGNAFTKWGTYLNGCISMNNTVNGGAVNNASLITTGQLTTIKNFCVSGQPDTGSVAEAAVYVSGTFTPTIAGSTSAGTCTYTTQYGNYQKTGNVVNFQINVGWTSHTGTGNILIQGLPFTSINRLFALSATPNGITLPSGKVLSAAILGAASTVFLTSTPTDGSSGTYAQLVITSYTSGNVFITGSYITA